jgi:hypothetical protein
MLSQVWTQLRTNPALKVIATAAFLLPVAALWLPEAGRTETPARRRTQSKKAQKGGAVVNPATEPKTVVFVEPRRHAALEFVLRNVLDNLDTTWSILLIHGTLNRDYIESILNCLPAEQRQRITLQSLERSVLPWEEYNRMMMTREFYEKIPTEIFLIVQTDSMICPDQKHLLTKFLEYDLVGAPWNGGEVGNEVGNGGFTLRRKSKILEILDKCPPRKINEDGFFARGCAAAKARTPTAEEAKEFSVETIYAPQSFGVHKPWYHLPDVQGAMNRQCRGLATLKSLQKEV